MKSMDVPFMYCMHVSVVDMIPMSGNSATGIRDVMARGSSSHVQNTAIRQRTYAHFDASVPWTMGNGSNNSGTSTVKMAFQ